MLSLRRYVVYCIIVSTVEGGYNELISNIIFLLLADIDIAVDFGLCLLSTVFH